MDNEKKEPHTSDVKGSIKGDINIQKLTEKLNSFLVNNTEDLKPPIKAWGIIENNKSRRILGTLGNFSVIIGRAKSRKSFFINIAVSCAISNDPILGKFESQLPSDKKVVLYFDTEQGKYHVQLALKRICKQTGINEPSNLKVYGLRSLRPKERLELIEFAINNNPNVGFVVIDGIKDLVTSINSEEEATSITSDLLKWTEEKNIHIVCVLHQNKSDLNARGHIGTELVNKAETVLSVTKTENDKDISIVEAIHTRNKEPESFAFEINNEGIPVLVHDYSFRVETKQNQRNDLLSIPDDEQYELLTEVFKNQENYTYSDLLQQIKLASTKKFKKNIGDNKIKLFITSCKNNEWLFQEKKKGSYNLKYVPFMQDKFDPIIDGISF
jgi:predicted ATP-dependent serine protease